MKHTYEFIRLKLLLFCFCSFVWMTSTAQNDLALSQSVDNAVSAVGTTVNFTITLDNVNGTTVNNVTVTNNPPAGLTNIVYTPSAGSVTGDVWDIGTIDAGTSSVQLTVSGTVSAEGVLYNVAEITTSDTDDDSTPGNGSNFEDDLASACTTVPIVICPTLNDEIELEAPAGLTNYMWIRNKGLADEQVVANTQIYTATTAGSYTFEAEENTCPAGNCCPIVIEEACFDLGLQKTLAAGQNSIVNPGDDVTFTITIYNQGDLDAVDFDIIDYVNTSMFNGFSLGNNAAGTVTASDGTVLNYAWATSNTDGRATITGTLAAGASLEIPVTLTVANGAPKNISNYAEIFSDNDRDVDSVTEDTQANTSSDVMKDDVTNEDSTADPTNDEDDSDVATLQTCVRLTDLAVNNSGVICEGEMFDFTITHDADLGDMALYYSTSNSLTAAELYDFANHGTLTDFQTINASISPAANAMTTAETGVLFNTPGTYTVYAILAQGNQYIEDPNCQPVVMTTITVSPQPDLVTTNAAICEGESVDLATTVTDNNSTTGTIEYFDADPTGGATALGSATVSPTATTTYYIRKTTSDNCTDTETVVVTVTLNPDLTATDISICEGETIDLTQQITDANSTSGTTKYYATQADFDNDENEILDPTAVTPTNTETYYVRKT
ncbi:MAG: hypothetical protein AAGK47_07700, partial [Bacteroidota bacterium]